MTPTMITLVDTSTPIATGTPDTDSMATVVDSTITLDAITEDIRIITEPTSTAEDYTAGITAEMAETSMTKADIEQTPTAVEMKTITT